jgi:hypothetical protein
MIDNYEILNNGVIRQINKKNKIIYNYNYVNNSYNSYGERGSYISYLRLGYILGSIGKIPSSILDVGYGNGDFIKTCSKVISNCYGNDISGYNLPEGVSFVEDITSNFYEVITFFDSLEHFGEIDFVKDLKCNFIVISLPWCHYFSDEWFKNWKHRREDEHLYHFNDISLNNFMNECGFDSINILNLEDSIRIPVDDNKNILTGIYKKRLNRWL